MDVDLLGKRIAEDRQNGLHPMAVVATVGTTSTASVDPVRNIGKICREANIWLHIDAAYGGGFAMVPEYQWMREGWELADSIVINPHKTVFVPLDFSVLYVRDLARLQRVFSLVPEYLRGDTVEAEKNYMDYGIQLGRRFRALKAWVIWRSLGRAGVVARLREQIRLANLLVGWIEKDERFELSAQPSMGVVCFRFVGEAAPSPRRSATARGRTGSIDRIDAINSAIVERINASGRAYLTQTKLRGRTVMRIGLGNVLTTEEHLRKGWEIIRETAADTLSS
jgi:aromatic-L-amino-acid/L-tryptophan decarboxylase